MKRLLDLLDKFELRSCLATMLILFSLLMLIIL